jgi:ribonuclease Z
LLLDGYIVFIATGRLCKGETITMPDGRQVKPSDCIGPPRPGTVFVIVHCPSEEYVDVLVHHPAWRAYTCSGASKGAQQQPPITAGCILHITPQHVLAHSDAYRAWMHSFGAHTQVSFIGTMCACGDWNGGTDLTPSIAARAGE